MARNGALSPRQQQQPTGRNPEANESRNMKKISTDGSKTWTVGELLDGIEEIPASKRIIGGIRRARFVVIADETPKYLKTIKSLEKEVSFIRSDRVEVHHNWDNGITINFDI